MPEFEDVNSTIMAWADFYIAMRGVAPTLSDMTKARALYARVPHGKTQDITVFLARRYNRWHDYQELAAWMGPDEKKRAPVCAHARVLLDVRTS